MDQPITHITPEIIDRNMRHARKLRAYAMLGAIRHATQAMRKGFQAVISVFV